MIKQLLSLLAFTITCTGPLFAQGPTFYFSFDQTEADASGNAASLEGPVRYGEGYDGSSNAGLEFLRNHFDDVIVTPGAEPVSHEPPFTYAAWIRWDSADPAAAYPVCSSDSTNFHGGMTMQRSGAGTAAITFGNTFGGGFQHRYRITGTTQLQLGSWYHIAVTIDVDSLGEVIDPVLYVDGTPEVVTVDGTGNLNDIANFKAPFRIGQKWNLFFVGGVDELVGYDRALTPAEIIDVRDGVLLTDNTPTQTKLSVYPNVASDVISIDTSVGTNWSRVVAVSAHGQQFELFNIAGSTFDVSRLPAATYHVLILTEDNKAVAATSLVKI